MIQQFESPLVYTTTSIVMHADHTVILLESQMDSTNYCSLYLQEFELVVSNKVVPHEAQGLYIFGDDGVKGVPRQAAYRQFILQHHIYIGDGNSSKGNPQLLCKEDTKQINIKTVFDSILGFR